MGRPGRFEAFALIGRFLRHLPSYHLGLGQFSNRLSRLTMLAHRSWGVEFVIPLR